MAGKIVWVENSQELTELLAPVAEDAGFEITCHHEFGPETADLVAEALEDAAALILDLELVPGLRGVVGRGLLRAILERGELAERFADDSLRLGVLSAHLIDHDFVEGVEKVASAHRVRPVYMPKSADMTRQQWSGERGLELQPDRSDISAEFIAFLERLTEQGLADAERRDALEYEISNPWKLSYDEYLELPEIAQFAFFDAVSEHVQKANSDLRSKGMSWAVYCGSAKPLESGSDPADMPDTEGRREIARSRNHPCFGFLLTDIERVESITNPAPCPAGNVKDYPYVGLNLVGPRGGGASYRQCHYDSGSPTNFISNQWLRESGLVLTADEFIMQEVTHLSMSPDHGLWDRIRAVRQARTTTLRIADWHHSEAYLLCPVEGDTTQITLSARVIQNWSDWSHAVTCAEMGCTNLESGEVCIRRHALLGRALLRDNTSSIDSLSLRFSDGVLMAKVEFKED